MNTKQSNKNKPLVLAILDGWGVGPKDKTVNAIEAAKTPFLDGVRRVYPYTELDATGRAVGLEENQMSGSEAGHLNIGAGRVVKQDVLFILEDINSGAFFYNPVLLNAVSHAQKNNSNIHLMGLMGTNDSPHSHPDIFLALMIFLKQHDLKGRVFIHLFTDGRDSFPKSAIEIWNNKWKKIIEKTEVGTLSTVCGRFYAMDRVRNWDRPMKAYNLMTKGSGEEFGSFEDAICANYSREIFDEYIEPAVIAPAGKKPAFVQDNDSVIFFNFRSDRARQISKLFVGTKNRQDKNFPKIKPLENLVFVAMTNFGPDLEASTAYTTTPIKGTLPSALESLRQLYISETEKYAHVTYFVNGGYSKKIDSEERTLVPSLSVRSYAERPQMSADGITKKIIESLKKDKFDFILVNFPNADMVGHTGNFQATVEAVSFLDEKLAEIYNVIKEKDGTLIITADHGNADIMIDKDSGRPFTFHTKNPVPFFILCENPAIKNLKLRAQGRLSDVTPTILDLLDLPIFDFMTGKSLIEK